jgi:hypothetical protein
MLECCHFNGIIPNNISSIEGFGCIPNHRRWNSPDYEPSSSRTISQHPSLSRQAAKPHFGGDEAADHTKAHSPHGGIETAPRREQKDPKSEETGANELVGIISCKNPLDPGSINRT